MDQQGGRSRQALRGAEARQAVLAEVATLYWIDKLTQEQIARVLGVYRPSVTCIAQSLRDAGLIDYVRGNIIILDREALRERGCGCYSEPITDGNLLRFDEKIRAV